MAKKKKMSAISERADSGQLHFEYLTAQVNVNSNGRWKAPIIIVYFIVIKISHMTIPFFICNLSVAREH